MLKKYFLNILIIILIQLSLTVYLRAAESDKKAEEEAIKLVKKLEGNKFMLGDITIDKNANSIRFPAKVNMHEGVIELLLCAPYGKTHESLLVTDIDAIHLNLALIMIGCKAGEKKVSEQGEDVIPDGTLLTIEIAYKEDEKDKEEKIIRAEDWILDKKQNKPMAHTNWVYTGSFVSDDGEYLAKLTGTYIVTFHDPYTIIDIPLPEGADDTIFWINKDAVKKKGFPVELIITVVEQKENGKNKEANRIKTEGTNSEKGKDIAE